MKKLFISIIALSAAISASTAEFNWGRALSAAAQYAQAATISDDDIIGYARQSVAQMDAGNTICSADSEYSKRLRRITENFTSADGIPLNFKVYVTNDVNAFACPDGSVRVYTGLMDIMDDDELTGIVGHEIGHVAKRHSLKALQSQLKTGALAEAIGSLSDTAGALADSYLSQIGQVLVSAKFSRKQENEADDYGYDFLKQCGKNPRAMIKAFQKLQSMEQQGGQIGSYITRMFSSHPETRERIQRMEKRAACDGY